LIWFIGVSFFIGILRRAYHWNRKGRYQQGFDFLEKQFVPDEINSLGYLFVNLKKLIGK
jgi:hypothetical protein